MSALTALPLCLILGALFEVQTIPMPSEQARVFVANADTDQTADVFVLDGSRLTAYASAFNRTPIAILFEPGTSGFDVADIDGSGQPCVIAVQGDRIMRYLLSPTEGQTSGDTLFELTTQLALPAASPFPYVISVEAEGKHLLALPRQETFELRSPDGELFASYPFGSDAPRSVSYGEPFSAASISPPRAASPVGMEIYAWRLMEFEPAWDQGSLPIQAQVTQREESEGPSARSGMVDNVWWSWFPLRLDETSRQRVLFSMAATGHRETLVWIRDAPAEGQPGNAGSGPSGPKRRFPGLPAMSSSTACDFNGDGFADLFLWRAPEPAMTVDAVTRALTGAKWPAEFMVFLYSADKKRHEPTPHSRIRTTIPLTWYRLTGGGGPLAGTVLGDFNGDGRTDFACETAGQGFACWVYGEDGFDSKPEFTAPLEQRLDQIAFQSDLDGSGRTSIGLRSKDSLVVLYAAGAPELPPFVPSNVTLR